MTEVMEHIYNEERLDFRKHLRAMFGYPPLPSERISVVDCREALEGFLSEREASIAWLATLGSPDWEATITLTFGPGEQLTLNAETCSSPGPNTISSTCARWSSCCMPGMWSRRLPTRYSTREGGSHHPR